MKYLLLGTIASLCALALYPVVLSVGQRVAQYLKQVQTEIKETSDAKAQDEVEGNE